MIDAQLSEKLRARTREMCLAFPDATVGGSGNHDAFEVRGKKFAYFLVDHHGNGRIEFQCRVPPGENAQLIAENPDHYFMPPYVGPRGWVGIFLDTGEIDWDELTRLAHDSYAMTAPVRRPRRNAVPE